MLSGFFIFYIYSLHRRIDRIETLLLSQIKRKYTIDRADHPRIGSADSEIEVLVFSDFTCPHCYEFYNQLERMRAEFIESKKVSFVFYSYPMRSHDNSILFSAIGKYGHAVNNFEPFYHRLFQRKDSLHSHNLASHFSDLVADTNDFKDRIFQKEQPAIEGDIQLIKEYQIKGAPAFIIDDQLHVGLKTDSAMREVLLRALKR